MTDATRPSVLGTSAARGGLLIVVALATLSGALEGSLAGPVYAGAGRSAKGKPASRNFAYTVSDCQGSDKTDSVGLELSEGTVAFHQILTMNCAAATQPSTVSVSYVKKARELEVTVVLKSDMLADCTCPIGIDGSISGLDKGAYRISFFYDDPSGAGAKEKSVRRVLGAKEFSIE